MRTKFDRGPTVVSKGGGTDRHTDYETFTNYARYNIFTANNVSNVGGDPVTQVIVNICFYPSHQGGSRGGVGGQHFKSPVNFMNCDKIDKKKGTHPHQRGSKWEF